MRFYEGRDGCATATAAIGERCRGLGTPTIEKTYVWSLVVGELTLKLNAQPNGRTKLESKVKESLSTIKLNSAQSVHTPCLQVKSNMLVA